jgi:molybdopterin-binding protein
VREGEAANLRKPVTSYPAGMNRGSAPKSLVDAARHVRISIIRVWLSLNRPYVRRLRQVSMFRVKDAASLLGVSDDTVRRWADGGRFETTTDESGRLAIDGVVLARFAQELAEAGDHGEGRTVVAESMRNRFSGLVTRVVRDTVMAQVDIQAGPHRFVSLLSREAADELGLEPGVLAVAAVKATSVSVEIPGHR